MVRRRHDRIADDEIHEIGAGGAGIAQPGRLHRRGPPRKGAEAGAIGMAAQVHRDIHFQCAHLFARRRGRSSAPVSWNWSKARDDAGADVAAIIRAGGNADHLKAGTVMTLQQLDQLEAHRMGAEIRRDIGEPDAVMAIGLALSTKAAAVAGTASRITVRAHASSSVIAAAIRPSRSRDRDPASPARTCAGSSVADLAHARPSRIHKARPARSWPTGCGIIRIDGQRSGHSPPARRQSGPCSHSAAARFIRKDGLSGLSASARSKQGSASGGWSQRYQRVALVATVLRRDRAGLPAPGRNRRWRLRSGPSPQAGCRDCTRQPHRCGAIASAASKLASASSSRSSAAKALPRLLRTSAKSGLRFSAAS